jgi:hypothetical protein
VRRDLVQLGIGVLLLLVGYAANDRWNTEVGGWRELFSIVGGVLFVAMLIAVPVAILGVTVRHGRTYLGGRS